jgi:hypothetical protein
MQEDKDHNLLILIEKLEFVKSHGFIIGNPKRFKDFSPDAKIVGLDPTNPECSESEEEVADLTLIKDINKDLKDYTIKARVAKKGGITKHARGQLFKIDLIDATDNTTMIEGMFYTAETEKFYDTIEEGKTYLISKADVSEANHKFTSIPH